VRVRPGGKVHSFARLTGGDALDGGSIMGYIGKTLVILNLVAAVIVAGFLAFDFATRANWKDRLDDAAAQTVASRAATAAEQDHWKDLKARVDTAVSERDKLRKELDALKADYQTKINEQKDIASNFERSERESKAIETAAKAEAARLRDEIKVHRKDVEERDKTIVALEDKIKTHITDAVTAQGQVNTLKTRLNTLLDQLEEANKKLARAETRGGDRTTVAKRSGAKNPPSAYVKGRVTGVLRDKGLIEISLGTDQGVNPDNTLEVYRLKPRPEYLGTLKILDADHHKAVGRLLPSEGGVRRSTVEKGDVVASRIVAR
jgi:predicted  nucleic acid-binding Zn-ribbon protein